MRGEGSAGSVLSHGGSSQVSHQALKSDDPHTSLPIPSPPLACLSNFATTSLSSPSLAVAAASLSLRRSSNCRVLASALASSCAAAPAARDAFSPLSSNRTSACEQVDWLLHRRYADASREMRKRLSLQLRVSKGGDHSLGCL